MVNDGNQINNKINENVSLFFEWINGSLIENYFIGNSENWDALCGALHVLNDLKYPKQEYLDLESINYLEVIGIMQTIYIEQDAIITLRNALFGVVEKKSEIPEKYKEIRDVRNKIFGHPTNKKTGGGTTQHFFDILDFEKQTISHISWGTDGEIRGEEICIYELVLKNSEYTLYYLEEFKKKFIDKINALVKNYTIRSQDFFKHSIPIVRKFLSIKEDDLNCRLFSSTLRSDIESFKEGLSERNCLEEFEMEIDVIEFLVDKIKPLLGEQTYENVEFYTYASTLLDRISKLPKELKDLENYATKF